MTITEEQLAELERLDGERTPGPWKYTGYSEVQATNWFGDRDDWPDEPCPGRHDKYHVASVEPSYGDTATGRRVANAKYIAAACNLAPALVAEVRELRKTNFLVRTQIEAQRKTMREMWRRLHDGDLGYAPEMASLVDDLAALLSRHVDEFMLSVGK